MNCDKLERNRELVDLLNIASEAYYNTGKTIMSDKHFDEAFKELQQLEKETGLILANSPTQNVGAAILENLNEVKHNHKMLSLDKCHTVDEVIKFSGHKVIVGMWKLDGMSVSIKYEDGSLISAETRGNGDIGVDITEHIKQFLNVPIHINKEGTYIIDGEAIITDRNFEEVNSNKEFANSRNLVSGTLNSLDTDVVNKRKVSFVAWDIIEGDNSNSLSDRLLNAELLGFDVTECIGISVNDDSVLDIHKIINTLKASSRQYGMPIDGIVFKFDNIQYGKSLGATSHHFRNGIAFKFEDNGVQTKIKNIEWSLGKTGYLTPVAVFEPVEIEGSTVERASLHNLSVLRDLDIIEGDTVEVIKSNQVIPQIRSNISAIGREPQYIKYPATCPKCGSRLLVEKREPSGVENVVCSNLNCGGKLLAKMKHFVSKNAMNIEGLSESKLNTLIDKDFINDFVDIYELNNNFGVTNDISKLKGFGKKSQEKLINAIEKSKNTTLDRFIYALSIPMIGRSAARTISNHFNGIFDEFSNHIDGLYDWTQLEDFGQSMSDSINDYFAEEYNRELVFELAKYMNFEINEETGDDRFSGLNFVVTGKVIHYNNRNEIKEIIESHGGKVTGSISKNTSYLINNNKESNSTKNKKAKELGIKIISEEEFINMIK